jgi:hypothetical protein
MTRGLSRNDKIGLVAIAIVIIIILLLMRRGNNVTYQSGDLNASYPVEPINANLHGFNDPGVKFALGFPELHSFAMEPGCKCQSKMVH